MFALCGPREHRDGWAMSCDAKRDTDSETETRRDSRTDDLALAPDVPLCHFGGERSPGSTLAKEIIHSVASLLLPSRSFVAHLSLVHQNRSHSPCPLLRPLRNRTGFPKATHPPTHAHSSHCTCGVPTTFAPKVSQIPPRPPRPPRSRLHPWLAPQQSFHPPLFPCATATHGYHRRPCWHRHRRLGR